MRDVHTALTLSAHDPKPHLTRCCTHTHALHRTTTEATLTAHQLDITYITTRAPCNQAANVSALPEVPTSTWSAVRAVLPRMWQLHRGAFAVRCRSRSSRAARPPRVTGTTASTTDLPRLGGADSRSEQLPAATVGRAHDPSFERIDGCCHVAAGASSPFLDISVVAFAVRFVEILQHTP